MLIFVERGGEADSLAPGKSLDWGTDALVVSANRNKVIRVTVYLASNENDQFSLEKLGGRLRKVYRANRMPPLCAPLPDFSKGAWSCLVRDLRRGALFICPQRRHPL